MAELNKKNYQKKRAFVEEVSLIFEQQGHSRISGQILAWLHVCEPQEQSFNDLVDQLDVSKASVSNMTRLLMQAGFIEKVRIPGDRQTYFKLVDHAWCRGMERQLELMSELRDISAKYQQELQAEGEGGINRLNEMHDFYVFVTKRFGEWLETYKKNCENNEEVSA